jgi:hypothetical protein
MSESIADIDYAAVAAGNELIRRAGAAVERRKYTDRAGSDWFLPKEGYYTPIPQYNGISGKAQLYATDDGKAYEVNVFTCSGKLMHRVTRKGLDAAFRIGQRLADGGE